MRLPISSPSYMEPWLKRSTTLRKELNTPHSSLKIFNTFDELITNPEIVEDRFWHILLSAG